MGDSRPSFFSPSVKLVDSACFVQMTFTDFDACVCVCLFLISRRMMADAPLPLYFFSFLLLMTKKLQLSEPLQLCSCCSQTTRLVDVQRLRKPQYIQVQTHLINHMNTSESRVALLILAVGFQHVLSFNGSHELPGSHGWRYKWSINWRNHRFSLQCASCLTLHLDFFDLFIFNLMP